MDKEDPEAFNLLLNFSVTIETNLHYSEKQEYIELAKNFLADQITADDFSYSFMAIYEGINRKLGQMKRTESLELANFLKPSPDPEIAMSDEKELKDCAQILLLKLQEE